ncbi:unnamed protein product, partial [Schistosoma turkestanicum]
TTILITCCLLWSLFLLVISTFGLFYYRLIENKSIHFHQSDIFFNDLIQYPNHNIHTKEKFITTTTTTLPIRSNEDIYAQITMDG